MPTVLERALGWGGKVRGEWGHIQPSHLTQNIHEEEQQAWGKLKNICHLFAK